MKNFLLYTSLVEQRHQKKAIAFVLFLGFSLRLIISFFTDLPNIHRDTLDYFAQANTILAGSYTNFFPNGYPFIISIVRLLTGNYDIFILTLLNVLMSTAIIYFSYDIAKRVFSSFWVALIAGFLVSIFPSQINYSRWLTSEVSATFFLTAGFFYYYRKKGWLSGLMFGLAATVRTELLPIAILVFIANFMNKKKWDIRFIMALFIPVFLISTYCYLKTGEFSMAGHTRINILCSITASGSYIDWNYADAHPEANTSSKALQLYIDEMRNNTVAFVKNRFANLWEMWALFPNSADGTRGIGARVLIGLSNLFLLLFGGWAWWKNIKRIDAFILIFPFLVITIVHIVFFAMQRYTYPVEPFMIVLAAWSVFKILSNYKTKSLTN